MECAIIPKMSQAFLELLQPVHRWASVVKLNAHAAMHQSDSNDISLLNVKVPSCCLKCLKLKGLSIYLLFRRFPAVYVWQLCAWLWLTIRLNAEQSHKAMCFLLAQFILWFWIISQSRKHKSDTSYSQQIIYLKSENIERQNNLLAKSVALESGRYDHKS